MALGMSSTLAHRQGRAFQMGLQQTGLRCTLVLPNLAPGSGSGTIAPVVLYKGETDGTPLPPEPHQGLMKTVQLVGFQMAEP